MQPPPVSRDRLYNQSSHHGTYFFSGLQSRLIGDEHTAARHRVRAKLSLACQWSIGSLEALFAGLPDLRPERRQPGLFRDQYVVAMAGHTQVAAEKTA